MLGINNRQLYNTINRDGTNISFWYCYWFFETPNESIWVLFNLQNKFTDILVLNVYIYDHKLQNLKKQSINLKFSEIVTKKQNDKLYIISGERYFQEIDFNNNKSYLRIRANDINIEIHMNIDDYTTNQASLIPRYNDILGKFVNVKGVQTYTPGEWFSDNPYIGKITDATINGIKVKEGNFWFDNFIACNNGYLKPYIWFVILTDDWLIYLLWFGTHDDRNNTNTYKPILIKDRKKDKVLYSGILGVEVDIVEPVNTINNLLCPIKMTYSSNKSLGDICYDDYSIEFYSPEIDINIRSIPSKSVQVHHYDYYKNKETDNLKMSESDTSYYKVLSNIKYVEYVNMVEVNLNYNGINQTFKSRQIIDAMYFINPTKDTEFIYNKSS